MTFEIVRSDADQPWHLRIKAANGAIVAHSEQYADPRTPEVAIAAIAEGFGIYMNRPPERDPETGWLKGEAPDGRVYAYPVTRVDEREDATPDDDTFVPTPPVEPVDPPTDEEPVDPPADPEPTDPPEEQP